MMRLLPVVWLVVGATSVTAQEVRVATEEPPHYAGEPMVVQLQVTGFEEILNPNAESSTSPRD